MSDYGEEEPDDFVYYGSSLDPLEEDDLPSKKPIRIEDQIVTDENGKRRFHGAFTGGFSAGYWNSVGSKEGWRPAEFKSSRSDRKQFQQKPEDYMDEEDLGAFGIAPQVLRAKDDYGENHVSKTHSKTVFTQHSVIPGLPALHGLLNPVKETIGIKLLRSMGWRPNQGTGERITKKEKKERRKKAERFKSYGCLLPPGYKGQKPTSDGEENESEDDSEQLFAPDDIPTFTVQPKENTFGLGYTGLAPRGPSASTSKNQFVLFEPTLSVTDKRKKLQIKGQAFGVGAFETEDTDIYAKDDMSQYDFELGPSRKEQKSSKVLALPAPDLLDGFIRATKPDPSVKMYQLPDVPRDWVPIHRNKKSRFDVKPLTENELKGLGRHDLNAYQRAVILDEVLDISTPPTTVQAVQAAQTVQTVEVVQASQKTIEQQIATFDFDSLLSKVKMGVAQRRAAEASAQPPDPEREAKRAELRKFVEGSAETATFRPFAKEAEKQFRFDAFNVLSKCGRLAEFRLLYPDSMTEWERERERVEFERAQELYRPLCGMMQNRFTSGGQIEENIRGGLVVELDTLVTRETRSSEPAEVKERDPAKRAAHRKHFGPLTRQRTQWKPDRLLCIRFNIPNPFPDSRGGAAAAAVATKGVPKRSGQKFSIFDVLDVTTPPQIVQPKEAATAAPPAPAPALEWNRAQSGQLAEPAEPAEAAPPAAAAGGVEQGPRVAQAETEEEEPPHERPPMDLFKAIFEGTDSEGEEEVEEDEKAAAAPPVEAADVPAAVEDDGSEDDVYGPRAPQGGLGKRPFVSATATAADDGDDGDDAEWVEKGRETKRLKTKEARQAKKKKKSSDKKRKKERKKKKKKRSKSSDAGSSSSDTDDDEIILRKLVHLKKKRGL